MDEPLNDITQLYQVNVVLWEGRHLALTNTNSKVVVSIDKRKETIYSKNNKTDCPYYNDFCIFPFELPLNVLLDKILTIKVYQKSLSTKLIGSFSVELATVWSQPNHQFYHKWAVFVDPKNPTSGVKGFIKCDIAVLGKGVTVKPTEEDGPTNLEENLLVPYGGTQDRLRTRIILSVFRADSFTGPFDGKIKLGQPYIKITYGGNERTTSIAKNREAPVWNEEIIFSDLFPPLMQNLFIEICDYQRFSQPSVGNTTIDIRNLYEDGGKGFLPTFGPNFLYLYQPLDENQYYKYSSTTNNTFTYMGRLLLSLRTEVIDKFDKETLLKKKLKIGPKSIPPLIEKMYFEYNKFILFAAIFDALLFDAKYAGRKIKIRIAMGPKKNLGTLKMAKGEKKVKKLKISTEKKTKPVSKKPSKTVSKKKKPTSKKKSKDAKKKKKKATLDEKSETKPKKKKGKKEKSKKVTKKKGKATSEEESETAAKKKKKTKKPSKKKGKATSEEDSEAPSEKKSKVKKKAKKATSEDESEAASEKKSKTKKKAKKATSEDESEAASEKKSKAKKKAKKATSEDESEAASEKKSKAKKKAKKATSEDDSEAPSEKKSKTKKKAKKATSEDESEAPSEKKSKAKKKAKKATSEDESEAASEKKSKTKKKAKKATSEDESEAASEKKSKTKKKAKKATSEDDSEAPSEKKSKTKKKAKKATSEDESEAASEKKSKAKKKTKETSKKKSKKDSKRKSKSDTTKRKKKDKKSTSSKKKKKKVTSDEESETALEKKPKKKEKKPSKRKREATSDEESETTLEKKPKKKEKKPSKRKREAISDEESESPPEKPIKRALEKEPEETSEREPEPISGKEPHTQLSIITTCNSTAAQTSIKKEDYSYITFSGDFPCINTFGEWPNSLKRMYCCNVIKKAIQNCTDEINKLKYDLQFQTEKSPEFSRKLKATLANLSKSCESILLLTKVLKLDQTNLCRERKRVYHKQIADIAQKTKIASQQKALKAEDEIIKISTYLTILTKYAQDPENSFPDTEIWLLQNNKTLAQYRIKTEDVAFSDDFDYRGIMSGKTQTILFKGKTGKIKAKVEILIWFGLADKFEECLKLLPDGLNKDNPLCSSTSDFKIPSQLICNEKRKFQCRVYFFQGKIFFGFDNTGLTDAFVRVILKGQNKRTSVHQNTLSPIWDETLVFSLIVLYGTSKYLEENPPSVTVELFDQDKHKRKELIGRSFVKPVIKFGEENYEPPKFPPKLKWESVRSETREVGQILMAAELLEITDSTEDLLYVDDSIMRSVPDNIRPHNVKYRLDVLFWGVRPIKGKGTLKNKVFVVLECGEIIVKSPVISNIHHTLNFTGTVQSVELDLPKELEYAPSFGLKLFYIGSITHKEIYVATCLVPNIKYLLLSQGTSLELLEEEAEGKKESHVIITEEEHKKEETVKKKLWKKITIARDLVDKKHASLFNIPGYCRNDPLIKFKFNPKSRIKYQPVIKCKTQPKPKIKFEPMPKCKLESVRKFKSELKPKLKFDSIKKLKLSSIHKLKIDKIPKLKLDAITTFNVESIFHFKKKSKPERARCDMKPVEDEEMQSWWLKYYETDEENAPSTPYLKVYEEELEAQPEFKGFQDYLQNYDMVTGHEKKIEGGILMAKLKAVIKLREKSEIPIDESKEKGLQITAFSNKTLKFVARVYVVCGKNLAARDIYGKSDPYLFLELGKHTINDRKHYFPKQLNPTFGKCFEFNGVFPQDYLLRIKVLDYDTSSKDDLIGETTIDLENRFYSKFHATCGIATTYERRGFNSWRDIFLPSEILSMLCKQLNLEQPVYTENEVVIEGHTFITKIVCQKENKMEVQSLMVLRQWHEFPLYGFHLVPEHVETRSLYHPSLPGIEQGKLVLWVDIFPANFAFMPPKVDITPQPPIAMELRAIVWNVVDVVLDDKSFIFNSRLSDIYVKGWILSLEEEMQKTDVHYRSLNGEGNFNWRFIFHFNYIPIERRMTIKKKINAFDLHPEERKVHCKLEIQVWDNDAFGDDFLGTLILELCSMPRGAKLPSRCTLKMFAPNAGKINLFKIKKTRGWWPFRRLKMKETIGNEFEVTGKIDLELEILTETEALYSPAGKGRKEPSALPPPNRPDISSSRILNPLKVFRYVVLNRAKKWLLVSLLIVFITLFFLIAFYAFPNYLVKRLLHA